MYPPYFHFSSEARWSARGQIEGGWEKACAVAGEVKTVGHQIGLNKRIQHANFRYFRHPTIIFSPDLG